MLVGITKNVVFFNDMGTPGPFGVQKRTGRVMVCRGKTGTNGVTNGVSVLFTEPLALVRDPRR